MNISPTLQQEIEKFATTQGISPEQFVYQALSEKIDALKQLQAHSLPAQNSAESRLREREGVLVFETESLDHIDFESLINRSLLLTITSELYHQV
jgi:hypothetical protein